MHSTETEVIIGTPGLVYGNLIAGKLGKSRTSKGSHLPSLLSEVTLFTELKNSAEAAARPPSSKGGLLGVVSANTIGGALNG